MLIVYCGPHRPGVDVEPLEQGPLGTAEYGKPIDLPDDVARGLLAQGEEHWTKHATPKKREKE